MKKIKRFIRNLKMFWGVLIHNEWWDYGFLYDIMHIQLKFMYDNWDKCHYCGSEVEKTQLKKVLEVLDRIIEDDTTEDIELFGELLFKSQEVIYHKTEDCESYTKNAPLISRLWD